jgi:mannosyltransferase
VIPPGRRAIDFLIITLLVLAAATRVWKLDHQNIWLDEAVSWDTGKRSLPELIEQTRGDIHPPLYYVLVHGWMAMFGESPAALRMLSVVFGLVAIFLAVMLMSRWLPRGPAALALLWLVVSPHMVAYAQEARMYAAVTAAMLAVCLFYRRWVESGHTSVGALVGIVLSMTAGLYLHYFTALILPALWLHVLLTHANVRRWLVANLAIAVLYLPWLPTAVDQLTRGQSWRQPVTIAGLPYQASAFLKEIWLGPHYGSPALLLVAAAMVLTVFGLGLVLLVVGVVPPIIGLVLLPFSGQMQLSRYLVYVTPLLVIATAHGLTLALPRAVATALLGAAVIGSLPWLFAYYGDTAKDTDVRQVVTAISVDQSIVVVQPEYMSLLLAYYTRNRDVTFAGAQGGEDWSATIDRVSSTSPAGSKWFVIEGRWDRFMAFDVSKNPRLEEVPLTSGQKNIRVFRIR